MMKIITTLDGTDEQHAGGKGRALLRLRERYNNVPPLFVISLEHVEEIDRYSDVILAAFASLTTEQVAVRSSANVEDQTNASFAGQFETVLNVSRSSLLKAIQFVYESRHSSHLKVYCESHGIQYEKVRMSVVVQQQIDSEVSGVCLTRHGCNSELFGVVDACWGLGQAIVQGWVIPDHYVFDREDTSTIVETRVANQLYMIRPKCEVNYERASSEAGAHIVRMAVPGHKRLRKKLSGTQVQMVADLALKIEEEEGYRFADIEFAFVANQLFLLQARPGTSQKNRTTSESQSAVS